MTKILDKSAALAAFHQSARPTAASLKQWDTMDGDIGAGPQRVTRSILASVIRAVHNTVPVVLALGFASYRNRNAVTGSRSGTLWSAQPAAREHRMLHPCR